MKTDTEKQTRIQTYRKAHARKTDKYRHADRDRQTHTNRHTQRDTDKETEA